MSQMGLVKRLGCTTAKPEVLKVRRAKGGLSNQSEKIMTDRYLLKQLFARQNNYHYSHAKQRVDTFLATCI